MVATIRYITFLYLLILLLVSQISWAAVFTVTSNADDGSAGTLRYVINQLNSSAGTAGSAASNNTINFNTGLGTITLTANLPVIQGNGATIVGPVGGLTITGSNSYSLFATYQASINLSGITLIQGLAQGGDGIGGGGGGLGAGGGIYVDLGQTLTLTNMTIQNCAAQGGGGANGYQGGGGGASWTIGSIDGTTSGGGGDYPGIGITRGGSAYATMPNGYGGGAGGSGTGTGLGGDSGGSGAGADASTNNGGAGGYCGGGGGASDTASNSAGGGGGNGGGNGNNGVYSGGGGGGYGSGGSGIVGTSVFGGGGGGGFGGGGGGGSAANGINSEGGGGGGFGGGGGSGASAGTGGNFAGAGVANNFGGGGAGIGGSVFVGDSAILQISDNVTSSNNSTAGGIGGVSGTGYANDIFLFQNASLQFVGTTNQTITFGIQADTTAPSDNFDAGILVNTTNNAVITMSSNVNNYQGGTNIQSGVLVIQTGALPSIGSVNIGASGTLTLMTNTIPTTGTFTNAGALNVEASFTPSNYTSFTNTGGVYVSGLGAIGGNASGSGSLIIGQDSFSNVSPNAFTTGSTISFPSINLYNTSTLTTTGSGSVTGNLYVLSSGSFSGSNISGSILTIGQDSFGNIVSGTVFNASQAISTFPTINVAAGSFANNLNAISNVNTAFNVASGSTAILTASVSGTGILTNNGTINNAVTNGLGLSGLITNNGVLNLTQSLSLNNTINSAGSITVSPGMTFANNGSLYLYNNASISGAGNVLGGGSSALYIGQDSLGNIYNATNVTISSAISGIPTFNVVSGTVNVNAAMTGVNTAFNINNDATANFTAGLTGTVAVSNAGTLVTAAPINVTSYNSSGSTQFVLSSISSAGSINATGAVNLGANPLVITSNVTNAIANNDYDWTIVSAASIAPLAALYTLPPNTVTDTWFMTQNPTSIVVTLEKSMLPPSHPIIGPVLSAMSLNPTNSAQLSLVNALGNALTQADLDAYVDELIPDLNSSCINVRTQDLIYNQVQQRISAMHSGIGQPAITGFAAGEINHNLSMWFGGFGSYADQNPRDYNFGYRAYSGGIVLGLDFEPNENNLFGIAAARSNTNVETKLSPGLNTRTIGYHILVYGNNRISKHYDRFVEWMLSGATDANYGSKTILISGVNFNTTASYHDYQGGALFNLGQTLKCNKNFDITPLGTMRYNFLHTPAYNETGSAAALYVQNNSFREVLTMGIGGKVTYKTNSDEFSSKSSLGALLAYDVISSDEITTANFLSGGSAFTFITTPERLSFSLGADCTFAMYERSYLQFVYDVKFANGYIAQAIAAKVKYVF